MEWWDTDNFINIHTHTRGEGSYILDISGGEERKENELCSYGIHPLFMDLSENFSQLEKYLTGNQIIAIGECGIDRNAKMNIKTQIEIFEKQVELSEMYKLPLIIHCVKAFPELISIYKNIVPSQPWIIHGYNNNRNILEELLKHGLYISAGKKLLNPISNIKTLLTEIPLEKLFLETDDSTYKIEEIYREVCVLLQIEMEKLKKIINDNFLKCFPFINKN